MVAEINSWIDEIPPIQQPMRFGNRAFRDFYDRVVTVMKEDEHASYPVADDTLPNAELS